MPSLASNAQVPGIVEEAERKETSAELDAIVARCLFGLTRQELEYVLDTFPIVRRRDEEKHGEYRTKRLILQYCDAVSAAASAGTASFPFENDGLQNRGLPWRVPIESK